MSYVEARGLWKAFGNTIALRGVDLSISEPGVHLFYGPNGSGKSTLIAVILGITRPNRGHIRVLGLDPHRHVSILSKRIAVAVEGSYPPGYLSGVEIARIIADIRGLDWGVVSDFVDRLGVVSYWRRPIFTYSMGMRKKLVLALAFASAARADLMVLDEPYTLLDSRSRIEVSRIIGEISERIPVILASHVITETEENARRVYLMANGRIVSTLDKSNSVAFECPLSVARSLDAARIGIARMSIDYENERVVVYIREGRIEGCNPILAKDYLDQLLQASAR